MEKITCFGLIVTLLFPLAGQSLPEDMQKAAEIHRQGGNPRQHLDILMDYRRVQEAQMEELLQQRDKTEAKLKGTRGKQTAAWISLAATALAAGSFALFTVLGDDAHAQYMAETKSDAINSYKDDMESYKTLQAVSLGTAGGLAGVGGLFFLLGGRGARHKADLKSINAQIELLQEALQ